MSSTTAEAIENVSDDECSSPEDSTTEMSRIRSRELNENVNKRIDQSILLHEILTCILKRRYHAPLSGDIKKCLELGYSSGILMMELASEFQECDFYGLDVMPNAPNDIYPINCHFEKGDFYEGIPYPDEHFDYVYLRYTYVTLKKGKHDLLLRELTRVLKKGGWIEFTEPGNVFRSKGPIAKLIEDAWNSKTQEDNLDVVKIYELSETLRKSGFINVKESPYDIPLGKHGGEAGISMSNYWKGWIQTHKEYLTPKIGEKSQQEFDEYIEKSCEEFDEFRSSFTVFNIIAQKT